MNSWGSFSKAFQGVAPVGPACQRCLDLMGLEVAPFGCRWFLLPGSLW
jgi:hypothetical protein